jgi:hypothetical protein
MTQTLRNPKTRGKTIDLVMGLGITALVALLFFLRPVFFEPIHYQL